MTEKIYLVTHQHLDYDDYPIGNVHILGAYETEELANANCPAKQINYGNNRAYSYPERGYSIKEVSFTREIKEEK